MERMGALFIGHSGDGDTATGRSNDGQVRFTYEAPEDGDSSTQEATVTLSFHINGNTTDYERVMASTTVTDDDSQGGGSPGNPGPEN